MHNFTKIIIVITTQISFLKTFGVIKVLFLPDVLWAGRKPRQLREGSAGVVSLRGPAPQACWLTRTSGSSLKALPPSPFVFQCSALISYQSHTSHSTYTVKALRNITEINKAPKHNKRSKVLSCTHWEEEGGCTNLLKNNIHTQARWVVHSCFLFLFWVLFWGVFSCRSSRWSFQIIVIFYIFSLSSSRWEGISLGTFADW